MEQEKIFHVDRWVNYNGNSYNLPFIFCPDCGFMIAKIGKETIGEEDDPELVQSTYIECAKCHRNFDTRNTATIDPKRPRKELIWAGCFDHGDIVRFKWIVREVTAWGNKLQIKHFHQYVSINTKTGMSYLMAPWIVNSDNSHELVYKKSIDQEYYKKNKKIPGLKKTGERTRTKYIKTEIPKIRNCTYGRGLPMILNYGQDVLMECYNMVYDKVSKNLGYNPMRIMDYVDTFKIKNFKLELGYILAFNRAPNMFPKHFLELDNMSRAYSNKSPNKSTTHKIIKSIKNTDSDPLKKVIEYYNIPKTKSVRKLLLQNICNGAAIKVLLNYFSLPNVVKILSNSHCDTLFGHYDSFSGKNESKFTENKVTADFLRKLISIYGETLIANKLTAMNANYEFQDAAKNYHNIMEYDPNYVLNLNGTMLEIHDRLSDIYDKLSNPKVEIPYKEEDYGYEDNVNGYIFHLAKDTYELKDVGHAMHICVGGYGDDAINKHCTIVICTKDDELKVCIELSGDMKKICQAKLHDNKYPMDEIRDVILKWIKKHDIQINTNDLDGIDRRIRYHNEDNAQLRHNVPLAIRQNVKSSIQNIDSTLENLYAEFAMNPNLPIFNKDVEQGTEYKEAI